MVSEPMILKDATYELIKAYYDALYTKVTVDAIVLPVYSFAPKGTTGNRILIGLPIDTEFDTVTSFGRDYSIDVDCLTEFTGGSASYKKAFDIADAVSRLIKTAIGGNLTLDGANFEVIHSYLELGNTLTEDTDTGTIIRRILTFRNIVQQLT